MSAEGIKGTAPWWNWISDEADSQVHAIQVLGLHAAFTVGHLHQACYSICF